ncbi:MAG: rhodanese-like domain-containing protein [Desulfobacteraceae bacterium]|jgi:rhodanese-related sulfurtransferase
MNKVEKSHIISTYIFFILAISFFSPIYALNSLDSHESNSLFISAKSILNDPENNRNILFIDVRDKNEFEEYHIPDSLNIPLYTIKTKRFLRDKNIVLINNGFNLSHLKETGEELITEGYSVKILHGGILSWKKAGGQVTGDPVSIKNLYLVSAKDLYSEINKGTENLLVMNLTYSPEKDSLIENPNINNVSVRDNKDILIMFNNLVKKKETTPYLNVLIANYEGTQYEKIAHVLKGYEDKNIFFLKGGMESYQAFLNQQAMLKKRGEISSVKQDDCGSCSR